MNSKYYKETITFLENEQLINALKEKINDMEDIVNDELTDQDIQEGRLDSLSEKIKDLQRQINRIVNK